MEYSIEDIVTIASYVISIAAIVAAWFPKGESANKYIQAARKIVDFVGQNYRNAKNK